MLLSEMAFDRSKIKDVANALFQKIFEHWCLLNYTELHQHDCNINDVKHWRNELCTFMQKIAKMPMKHGNNRRAVFKAIHEAYVEEYEYDRQKIWPLLIEKFDAEHVEHEFCKETAKNFQQELIKIIEVISTGDLELVYNYCQSLGYRE